MAPDDTVLEPPVTPAPIFAYRALRSIFFGSPDSSLDHDNKENIVPFIQSHKITHMTSAPSKPTAITVSEKLTPQKRKRNTNGNSLNVMLSPTKSCLRTPGLATPRAELLRDINVTFRSVSPEVKRKDVPRQVGAGVEKAQQAVENDVKNNLPAVGARDQKPAAQVDRDSTVYPSNATHGSGMAITNTYDLEAYIRRTEKEMKRLVKYGQKMREYAHKTNDENAMLKQLLEDARRENERLKKHMAHGDGKAQSDVGKRNFPTDLNFDLRAPSKGEMSKNRAVSNQIAKTEVGQKGIANTFVKPPRQSSMRSELLEIQMSSGNGEKAMRPDMAGEPSQKCVKLDLPIHSQRIASTASNGISGTRNLPPDRLAAAKERVRRKRELRKSSMDNGDSQVDWAAL